VSNLQKTPKRKEYQKMKSLKNLLFAGLVAVLLLGAFSTEASAWPRVRVYAGVPTIGVVKVKPGPNYVWVEGHYKINKHGRLVWIPGHWKRI
jgi:hypothetical protein